MNIEEKLSYYVARGFEGQSKEKYYENFGKKPYLLVLSYTKLNEEIVKVYEHPGVLTIEVYPDGTYNFSIDTLYMTPEDMIHHFDMHEIISQWYSSKKIKKFQDSSLTHIDDKALFEKIQQNVIKMIKEGITKDTCIKSHIFHELRQHGYNVDTTEIFDMSTDEEYYTEYIDMSINISEVLKEHYSEYWEKNKEGIIKSLETKYFFNFLEDVFGSESKEYKQAIEIIIDDLFDGFIDTISKDQQIVNMFKYCVMKYTMKYSKYISENINTNISLKQAYNALPENFKVQITKDIFHGEGLSTKLLDDIIEVFSKKCKQKDGKQYTKREILLFLTDISMKQLKNIMPDDFDDSYDEPKSNPKKK